MESQLLHAFTCVIALVTIAPFGTPQNHPQEILEIYREFAKPGTEAANRAIEDKAAEMCIRLGCPHPYLGIESLTGPKEIWFLNSFASEAEIKHVRNAYEKNAALMAAMNEMVSERKPLSSAEPINVFTRYRPDLSHGTRWSLGEGRFLVISLVSSNSLDDANNHGTVFQSFASTGSTTLIGATTDESVWFAIRAAHTREQAEDMARAAGARTFIFAIRPEWSMPAKEWIAADPEFWRDRSQQILRIRAAAER
jgi:hypothetical protein